MSGKSFRAITVIVLGLLICFAGLVGWAEGWNAWTFSLVVKPKSATWRGMRIDAPPCFVVDEDPRQVHVRSGLFCFSPRLPPGVRWLSFFERPEREVAAFADWDPCGDAVGSCERYRDTVEGHPVECFREVRDGRATVTTIGCRVPDVDIAFDYTCTGPLCGSLAMVVAGALRSYSMDADPKQ